MSRIESSVASATPTYSSGADNTYTVKSGDTLSKIAIANGLSLNDIVAANPQIKNPDRIEIGQEINLPQSAEDPVKTVPQQTSETPQTTSEQSGIAGEAKSMLDLGAGLLRRSLQSAVDTGKGLYENLAGKEVKIAPGTPPAPEQPATPQIESGPNASRAQELARTTPTGSESEKFDHFKQLIEAGGGKFNSEPNARNIVAIRTPDSVDANGGKGVFNDHFAVVWKDENGEPHVKEFTGNTDPDRYWADKDGKKISDTERQAGRVLPGYHEFKLDTRTNSKGVSELALRPTENVAVERDVNRDGLFNDGVTEEGNQSFLIHNSHATSNTGSAGCQTIPPDVWPEFLEAASQGSNPQNIGYTLVQLDSQ